MADLSTTRFAEHVTSGAFALTLTRKQVSALAMVADRGESRIPWPGLDGLERKGLVTMMPPEHDYPFSDAVISPAGIRVAQLCAMAGLTNAPIPTEAEEIERLHRELAAGRDLIRELRADCQSLAARLDEMTRDVQDLEDKILNKKPTIRFPDLRWGRDQHPEKDIRDMAFLREKKNG